MRKTFLALAALALFFPAAPAAALSVGAPGRGLEEGRASLSGSVGYTALDLEGSDASTKSFLLKASFAPLPGLTPYLKAGFADLTVDDGGFEGSLGFAVGAGAAFTLLEPGNPDGLWVGLDGQVLTFSSKDGSVDLSVTEAQAALVGAVHSDGSTGYGGVAFSFIRAEDGGYSREENGKTHLFFGMDYYLDANFYFSVEAHLFGEDTLSLGVGYLF